MVVSVGIGSIVSSATHVVSCELGEETTLLSLRNGAYYGLDEVGTCIWKLIQKPIEVKDVRDALLQSYDVDASTCEVALLDLLASLSKEELIQVTPTSNA